MKRLLALVMIAVLIITACFTGCKREDEVVELNILMDYTFSNNNDYLEKGFKAAVEYFCPNKNIILNFEFLKLDAIERETQLSRIRTEIMAGRGPDIFILPTWETELLMPDDEYLPRAEPLFKDIEDAMRNGVFLPLDDYIEKSEYINLDEHIEIVMQAGRTDEGQLVLPYTFEYALYTFDADELVDPNAEYLSFADITGSDDVNMKYSLGNLSQRWIHSIMPDYVDYDAEKLTISEKELADMLKAAAEVFDDSDGIFDGVVNEFTVGEYMSEEFLILWNSVYEDTVPVVIPNTERGVSATITSFVAISRNTEYPQEAFDVIAPLFSEKIQGIDQSIWVEETERYVSYPIDTCTDAGAQRGIMTNKKIYNESNFYACWQEFEPIHNRITDVRFMSEMDCMLYDAWGELFELLWSGDKDKIDFDAIAAELYSDWKMMVAE